MVVDLIVSRMGQVGAALALVACSAQSGSSRPQPECRPPAIDRAEALAKLKAGGPLAPLARWSWQVELSPCDNSVEWDRVTLSLEAPLALSPGGIPYRARLELRLARKGGAPEETPALKRRIGALSELGDVARMGEGDPKAKAWLAAFPPRHAIYEPVAPKGSESCIRFVSAPPSPARMNTLQWCTGAGVAMYSVDRWDTFAPPEVKTLRAYLRSQHGDRALQRATLRSKPRQPGTRWSAVGTLAPLVKDTRPTKFRVITGPDGKWTGD